MNESRPTSSCSAWGVAPRFRAGQGRRAGGRSWRGGGRSSPRQRSPESSPPVTWPGTPTRPRASVSASSTGPWRSAWGGWPPSTCWGATCRSPPPPFFWTTQYDVTVYVCRARRELGSHRRLWQPRRPRRHHRLPSRRTHLGRRHHRAGQDQPGSGSGDGGRRRGHAGRLRPHPLRTWAAARPAAALFTVTLYPACRALSSFVTLCLASPNSISVLSL